MMLAAPNILSYIYLISLACIDKGKPQTTLLIKNICGPLLGRLKRVIDPRNNKYWVNIFFLFLKYKFLNFTLEVWKVWLTFWLTGIEQTEPCTWVNTREEVLVVQTARAFIKAFLI